MRSSMRSCVSRSTDWVRVPEDRSERLLATVLFTDIVGSTELAGQARRPRLARPAAAASTPWAARSSKRFRGREIDTAGDGFFAIFDGPARAMRCAEAMVRDVKAIGIDDPRRAAHRRSRSAGDKVSGMAVHIGARVMALAGAGEVLVSSTVKDLVAGSGIGSRTAARMP